MGSTLLIDGQPLQVGQTGTIYIDVYGDSNNSVFVAYYPYRYAPVIVPPLYASGFVLTQIIPYLVADVYGTITIYVSGSTTSSVTVGYLIPSAFSPLSVYKAGIYNVLYTSQAISTITVDSTVPSIIVATISISNAINLLFYIATSTINNSVIGVKGILIYNIKNFV